MSEESDREHEDRKTETEWMEGERELERAVKNRIAAGNKMAVVALRKLVKWVPECGFPKNVTPFYCDEKLRNSIDEYREEQGLNDPEMRFCTEGYTYELWGKEDARSFLSYLWMIAGKRRGGARHDSEGDG